MNKYLFIFLTTVLTSINSIGQMDTLNRRNSAGEKSGWWITYLDENLVVLEDSIGATHCMYNYYTGKFFHYRYGNGLGSKKYPVNFPSNDTMKLGNYILLNGNYTTKYSDGQVRSVLSTSNGILLEYKLFYEDGKIHEHFIYSAQCGAPIHTCLKDYDKNGVLVYDGLNYVPKEAELDSKYKYQFSDTSSTSSGILDGKYFVINVTQVSGKEDKWPVDTLKFNAGKLCSIYMDYRENFSPSIYSISPNESDSVDSISFKCTIQNPYGSHLLITGTVEGTKITGTITWTSDDSRHGRTYNFDGTLH